MHPDVPYFVTLLCLTLDYFSCLMPDDFTRQGESAAAQWVNQTICPCTLLTL
jgi:cytosine/uracil/thiamine/allantoin permease